MKLIREAGANDPAASTKTPDLMRLASKSCTYVARPPLKQGNDLCNKGFSCSLGWVRTSWL
jgi:hypothetical protein